MIRKKLFLCSKTISNLGSKPKIYIVETFSARTANRQRQKIFPDYIFELRRMAFLYGDIEKVPKEFVEFNHFVFSADFSTIYSENFKYWFHDDVWSIDLDNCNIVFDAIIQKLPKLEVFNWKGKLPEKWEKKLMKMKSNPKICRFEMEEYKKINFKYLYNFIISQPRLSYLRLKIEGFNPEEIMKYFIPKTADGDELLKLCIHTPIKGLQWFSIKENVEIEE